ncbi:MAG: DNA-binding protein Alba [Candidatus Bathyarchaeota archaeon]|nr:DNA-binding protein Alba [Candidatus Bathyarchaeum sp.]
MYTNATNNEDDAEKLANTVFIGKKPAMNYVTACITFFNTSEQNHVTVKARGRAISKAVDTVELLRRAFIKNLEISNISISTEELYRNDNNQKSNVSTIEIIIKKSELIQVKPKN